MIILDAKQTANFAEALSQAPDRAAAERLAFAIWTESHGYNFANDGRNTSHSPGFGPDTAAILQLSMKYPHDTVGSNGRSTGILQQTSSDVGGAWGDMGGTMTPTVAAQRFLAALTVTDNPVYSGKNLTPSGQSVNVDVTLTAVAADVLRVQQPLADEARSSNYDATQVAIAQEIAAQFAAPADWITMATQQDVANAVTAAVNQTGVIQRLDALTTAVAEIPVAVWTKGITGSGTGQHANEILAATAGSADHSSADDVRKYVVGGYSGATIDDSNIAGIWHMVDALGAKIDALAKVVALLVK